MTFSFDPALADNVSLVRFHIGDTAEDGYYLDDQTIQYFVTADGVPKAVIKCIRYIISQLSQPDFRQDWLSVNRAEARKGYENLLKAKAQELGVSLTGATAATVTELPYRADSYMTSSTQDGAP